ncbi:hypothetical protein Tco_0533114 [Tanacetum coccineum]
MNNKKHILDLDQFRDILQICPKVGNKKFEEPPLEKEILAFLASLGHSGEIRKITDVNVNKLHQPWRSFAAIINKCLSGKPSYDSLRLSQAQILWGMYNKKKVDYAYLLWEDFTYQIENKNTKKGNAMYYPRFTKLIVNFVMAKDPSIPRRNKVNWHYARDDPMFTTINVISRNEDTQLYGAILPTELTNEDIRISESYKEYHAIASGKIPPKTKGSKKKADTDTTTKMKPPTVPKEKKEKKSGKGVQLSTTNVSVVNHPATIFVDRSWQLKIITKRRPKENHSSHATGEKLDEDATYVEDQGNEADRDTNANLEGRDDVKADVVLPQSSSVSSGFVSNMLNPNQDTGVDAIFGHNAEATSRVNIPVTAIAEPSFFAPTNRPPTPTPLFTQLQQPQILTLATTPSSSLQNLPDFGSLFGFDNRLKALEDNFSEFKQTNQYAEALSSIPGIVDQYLANKVKEAVDVAVQLKSDRIREEAQAENQQFLDLIDEGMKNVIKEQVKNKVSKITPKIEKHLYKALVDAYEADKILLDTYGETVTIKRPQDRADDDQEPSAGTDRGSKRRRSGKEPESTSAPREKTTTTAGKTTTGSKTHKQSASQSAPVEETMQSTDVFEAPAHQEFETGVHDEQPEEEVHPLPDWFQQPKRLPSPDHAWNKSVPAVHESVQPWLSNLARRQDPRESFDELTDTTFDFSAFVMNRLNVTTLTPELLAGPTFELMKGTCKSLTELEYFCEEVYKATTEKLDWINPEGRQYPHDLRKPLPLVPNSQGRHVIPFHHFINNDLEYLRGGESSRKYSTSVTKTKAADYGHIKWIEDLVPNLMESAHDVYSKRRIIAVTKVEIVEWQNYKHLDWITVRRDDDILYKFKEGDFYRLRIQDIEDMLLLLVQGKLTNLNVEERLAFNVSLRMFTRSVVIQRRVEDLQLGVKSYQKKLNLTKPDTYRSNLRRRDAYTPYSDPRGFIYENKDKKNRLMRIDELHKFSDGTLDDVRTALNDRLKGIRMEYLPQTFWSQHDKANARAMIQAIDKRLKTRRIMQSLERFVGGRPYGSDLRLLQRTI